MISFLLGFILGSVATSSSDEKSERFYGWIIVGFVTILLSLALILVLPPRWMDRAPTIEELIPVPVPHIASQSVTVPRAELVR